jgi:nucleotide-binding universal stress UspA family protein
VTLLQVRPPARRLGGPPTPRELAAARAAGLSYLGAIADELLARAGADLHIEQLVAIADDWAPELLVHAAALKAQLILLGASEQRLRAAAARRRLETVLRRTPCDVAVYRGA